VADRTEVITTERALHERVPAAGCVVVPTMGALHAGHAALVRLAAGLARERGLGHVVVTVFVNPTQFNEKADYDRYPRTLEADAEICRDVGATAVFAPSRDEVYPASDPPGVPPLPRVATAPGLEDAFRPGHFAGVCQVVKRLFEMVRPAAAIFGEKDWQQLQVVRAMTRELALGVEIIPGQTVREPGGLAMSSRNVFLSAEDRRRAFAISAALCDAAGEPTPEAAERAMRTRLASAGITPEYAVVRDAETLQAPRDGRPARSLIAARVGAVRLIDNAAWDPHRENMETGRERGLASA